MNVYKDLNTRFDLETILFHLIQLDVDGNIILKWMRSCVLGSTDSGQCLQNEIYQNSNSLNGSQFIYRLGYHQLYNGASSTRIQFP